MRTEDFERALLEKKEVVDRILMRFLPEETGLQGRAAAAMNYSLLAGGKRLRPILMQETYRMCGGTDSPVFEHFMAAIEMIHTYSLVHDDLPAMDNDEQRRGKETTWHKYGETMGILAGDGLLNYAFETAAGGFFCCSPAPEEKLVWMERTAEALSLLARKAGIYGMIGGQAVDVMAEKNQEDTELCARTLTREQLLFIHEHKTGALIEASMMVGAILAGAAREQVTALEKCARNMGVAFQIQDDILDVVGNEAELGKPTGSDAQNQKQTYVTLHGLDQARADVESLSREAAAVLDGFEGEKDFLKQLIFSLVDRRK